MQKVDNTLCYSHISCHQQVFMCGQAEEPWPAPVSHLNGANVYKTGGCLLKTQNSWMDGFQVKSRMIQFIFGAQTNITCKSLNISKSVVSGDVKDCYREQGTTLWDHKKTLSQEQQGYNLQVTDKEIIKNKYWSKEKPRIIHFGVILSTSPIWLIVWLVWFYPSLV